MQHWIVAKTQSGKERWAGENIERQGGRVYLPTFEEVVVKRGRKLTQVRCLFPRYLFVFTENGQWRYLLGTFGVTGVILDGNGPAILPEGVIKKLKSRENNRGHVELPTRPRRFVFGQTVTPSQGPLAYEKGIYQGTDDRQRARVLMDFMGRKTTILIGEELLEAA
jgi:transcriptional antiterminator RfaH